ncbi:MAG: endolytic transglycosylase MltG [Gammaproteobacteria bacterium]|nr:MAG: endolytic transglycosylase MltG [Gammaproteobacteria bacterium]
MNKVVLINGKKQTKLSVFNRLTQFGDGLFETCLVKEGRLLLWSEHFLRLEKGRSQLKINPVSEKQWLKDIAKALSIAKLDQAVVKVMLSRGESQRGYGFEVGIEPTRIIIVSSVPEKALNQYVLTTCQSGYATNQLLSNIKHCNRLEQILARVELQSDEGIMLDDNGCVISVTQGNIFAIKSGVLLTPGLDECGIEGTRRSTVLKIAKDLGLQVNVGAITLQELYECDEVFITNSVIGIKPVTKINHKVFTQQQATQKITHTFNRYLSKRKNAVLLKSKKPFFKILLAAVAALILAWAYWANTIKTVESFVYQVPKGANINSTANDLKRYGLIHSSYFVVSTAKVLGLELKLKSGYYDIHPNMSVIELLKNFSSAKVANRNIALIEGETVRHYYQQLLNTKSLKSSGSLDETMRLAGIKKPYEGYFWPDTYQVNYGDSTASVLKRAHKIMKQKLDQAWQGRDKALNLKSADEALVLASLIEKETAHNAEKSKIAGVFMRRLKKGMRLQTDPTVVYALGKAYTGKLTKQDLKFNSPYNTYRHKGLPPTAISSVSQTSLYAAMHPASGDTLFFVAKKDGSHAFAKTYKQHRFNIKKYLK